MTGRTIPSGTEWESAVGRSRAVRTGDTVRVAGTTATDDGEVVGADACERTRRAIGDVADALAADASLADVLRTRLYVVDADEWEAVGRVHREAVDDVRPASTTVEASRLADPGLPVEVEATAVLSTG